MIVFCQRSFRRLDAHITYAQDEDPWQPIQSFATCVPKVVPR
jgi:hypothetical protein